MSFIQPGEVSTKWAIAFSVIAFGVGVIVGFCGTLLLLGAVNF